MYKRNRDDLRVVFEEQSLQFQRVLWRCSWAIFATIFSENARLLQLFKASEEASIYKLTQTGNRRGKFFIDSTPLPVCKNVLHATHRTFRGMAQWAHSSVSTTFGLKLHIVVDERQKIIGFTLKPGNLHDVICAEELSSETKDIALSRPQSGYLPRDCDSSHDVSKI